MLFKLLIVWHTLGATVWTGGHLVLALTVLPDALKKRDPAIVREFEEHFEGLGLLSLALQVITGLWIAWLYVPRFEGLFAFDSAVSTYICIKLMLLLGTVALAIHARWFIVPKLTEETLNSLAYHIVGVTLLAVAFVIFGVGIRFGGLA